MEHKHTDKSSAKQQHGKKQVVVSEGGSQAENYMLHYIRVSDNISMQDFERLKFSIINDIREAYLGKKSPNFQKSGHGYRRIIETIISCGKTVVK